MFQHVPGNTNSINQVVATQLNRQPKELVKALAVQQKAFRREMASDMQQQMTDVRQQINTS